MKPEEIQKGYIQALWVSYCFFLYLQGFTLPMYKESLGCKS